MPGYPDWQRVQTRVGAAISYSGSVNGNNQFSTGVVPVANYESVLLLVRPTGTDRWSMTVEYYQNADGSNPTVINQGIIGNGDGDLVVSLPVLGPYMSVTIGPGALGNGSSYLFALVPSTNPPGAGNLSTLQLINRVNATVAASTSVTQEPNGIWPGPAVLTFSTVSTNWSMNLEQLLANGTWQAFYTAQGTAGFNDCCSLILPFAPVRVHFINSAAAAAFTGWNLSASPS